MTVTRFRRSRLSWIFFTAALDLLDGSHQAITFSRDLVVEGSVLPGGITGTRDQHRQLREWAWLQHITEGIRAQPPGRQWRDGSR